MATEIRVKDKQELQTGEEQTVPGRFYVPNADIYETDEQLVVVMEIPGIDKQDVDINVDNDQLSIEGKVNLEQYSQLRPVYTEYNVGHFKRSFRLSNKIDSAGIDARIADGVLTLHLPKVAEAKPRKIKIS